MTVYNLPTVLGERETPAGVIPIEIEKDLEIMLDSIPAGVLFDDVSCIHHPHATISFLEDTSREEETLGWPVIVAICDSEGSDQVHIAAIRLQKTVYSRS